jgi:hypothetical protein
VTNETESFQALATRLHVNPTKLCEYNFLYDCLAGVTPGNSIRVPYDQCTPKPGGWDCYEVKDGDTLLSVASSPKSLNFDAIELRNTNLDILYSDSTLHAGMQLRLPVHTCFEDEINDCHIFTVGDTLASVAAMYKTTAQQLCKINVKILVDNYCDAGIKPLPKPNVGMELLVPTLRPDAPSPCREIPGYWSCYTVKANDTIDPSDIDPVGIPMKVGVSRDELIKLNFGKSPNHCYPAPPNYTEGCSNTTHCPPSKGPYPECLQIGQVLTVPIASACVPRPGVWDCKAAFVLVKTHGYEMPWDFFCKANRRAFPGCRVETDPKTVCENINNHGTDPCDLITANQTVKDPIPICIPNDKSYCSGTNSTVDGDVYHYPFAYLYPPRTVYCANEWLITLGLATWDGNGKEAIERNPLMCLGPEYHIPRGSLPSLYSARAPYPECTPVPGEHICHKPLPPVGPDGCGTPYGTRVPTAPCLWEDSVYQIAQQFGVDWKALCALNQMKNCSELDYVAASLKIPVRPSSQYQLGQRNYSGV